VVPKPVPQAQAQDPRQFQLGQIRRRFSPSEQVAQGYEGEATLLRFNLIPSDPDFPFEMTALNCQLFVPTGYPVSKPWLRVGNKDIPRGFALNVESGFDGLVKDKPEATLLELMKALDKNLEVFLSAPKAETVKLVPNKDTRHLSALPSRSVEPVAGPTRIEGKLAASEVEAQPRVEPAEVFTTEQKSQASQKREAETRQLEARMGRLPLFKKSGDGIAYTIPVEPRRRSELPVALQAVKSVQLFVPLLYPLQPCRIRLDAVDPAESKPVETGFEQRVAGQKDVTLMGHINYLAQNMHILAKTVLVSEQKPAPPSVQPAQAEVAPTNKGKEVDGQQDPERSHIQYITRPPEWTVDPDDVSDSDSDSDYSYDTESSEGGVEVEAEDQQPSQTPQNPERGTAISFPLIELYGIELLEVVTLNLSVKCERCKEVMEINGLKNGITKSESCRKCATALVATYRRELVHANAVRAGFLDLEGCVVVDMLPRYFPFFPYLSLLLHPYPSFSHTDNS
jgi:phage FluMu protein Com